MNKIKKIFAICAVAVILIVTAVGLGMTTQNASAYTALSENEMYMNLAGNALQKCYASGEMNASIKIQDYESYRNVSAKNAFQDLVLAGGSTMVYLPTGIGSGNNLNIRDGTVIIVNCNALLLGTKGSNGSLTGLFDLSGKTLPQPGSPNLVSQLADLGYTKTVNGTTGSKCIDVGYKEAGVSGSASKQAGTVCWDTTDLESGDIDDYASFTSKATYSDIDTTIRIDFTTSDTGGSVQLKFSEGSGYSSSCETPSVSFAGNDYNMVEVVNKLGSSGDCQVNDSYGNPLHVVSWKLTDKTAGGSVAEVSMENYGLAYRRGRNYFVGNGNMYNFAPAIQYDLYKMYLDKVYGVSYGSSCKSRSDVASGGGPVQTDDYGNKVYYVYNNGRYYNVTVPDANIKHSVATFVDNNVLGSYCDDFECLIKKIYDMNLAESGTCDDDDDDDDDGPTPGDKTTKPDFDCDTIIDEKGGKIGAMQWILCPTMNNTAYTANWIDNLTQNMLEVKTDRYDTKSDTYKGWGMVRNIANILIIVFLSVVVFSQLTGYGIDNYGIKKMLPRLIVMAIIINLSFYVCEIVIDLSNIAGVGLRNMFGSFGNTIGDGASGGGTHFITTSLVGIFSAFSTAGGPAIAAGAAAASFGWVAILIAAIVFVLVIIVAVVTLWLMLGVREIIIITCVILSPLAFAAFVLPNTQNLFKKWWDLFKAAIIVYPICGAAAGISYMLRGMSSSGDMGMGVAGRIILFILPYLVFFLLPTLLKNALAALGKVGGALTSMGNTIRNGGRAIGQGAMRAGQNTEAYKNMQSEAARRQQEQRATRIKNRFGDGQDIRTRIADAQNRINSTQDGTREHQRAVRDLQRAQADQRRFYTAQQTLYQLEGEQAVAETSPEVLRVRAESRQEALELKNYSDQYSTLTRPQMTNELNAAVAAYQTDRSSGNGLRLQAAIAAAEQRGMSKEMLEGNLSSLSLSTANSTDAKILGQMSGSSNKVVSQYGKQVGKQKPEDNVSRSMNQFIGAQANDSIGMTRAFANQGANVLNGMDDDTLGYISKINKNAVSTQMLVNAAMNTSNEKELTEINNILKSRVPLTSTDYELKPAELAKLNIDTVNSMNSLVYRNAVQELINTRNTDASRQIINSMDQKVREKFGLASTPPQQNGNGGQDFNDGGGI